MCVFISSKTFVLNISHSERTDRDMIKNVHRRTQCLFVTWFLEL